LFTRILQTKLSHFMLGHTLIPNALRTII